MKLRDHLLEVHVKQNIIYYIIAINTYDPSFDEIDLKLQIKNPDKHIEFESIVKTDSTYVFKGQLSVPYGSVVTLKGGRGNKLHGKIKIEEQKA